MPSSSKNESPKPTLTQKQMDLLSCVMANLKSQPEIDWDAVASQGGFASKASAREVYRVMRVKLGWPTTGSPSSSSSAAAAGSPKTPTKISKRNNPKAQLAATKAAARKRAAFEERQAAHDREEGDCEGQQDEEDGGLEI